MSILLTIGPGVACRDIIGQAGYRGVPAGDTKPSKRVYGAPPANEQHLHGAAVGITVDNPPERKSRGWGERPAYTHYNTANRTILASTSGWGLQLPPWFGLSC